MKKLVFLLVIAAIIMTVATCSKTEKEQAIKIGINVWPGYAHAFIAQEKRIFEKNGVTVELILRKDINESMELYRHRDVDGVFTLVPDVVIFNSEGISTKIVYVTDYSDTGDVIIGKGQYNSLAELKGKTVSFEGFNTFSHMFVLRSLEKAGIGEGKVKLANISAHNVLTALEDGGIDAGHTWEPVKSQALAKGYKILAKAGDVPGIITDVLAFNSKIVEERPGDVRAIIKSFLEARDFVYTNRDEALEIMSKAEGMNKEEMNSGINGVHQPDLKENIEAMNNLDNATSLHSSGKRVAEFFLKRGQISKIPDMSEIIEPRFVNELAVK